MAKRARNYRRAIRWVDGKLLPSPRFPRTPDGRAAAEAWYQEKSIEKKLILEGVAIPFRESSLESFAHEWIKQRKLAYPAATTRDEESRLKLHVIPAFGTREMHTIRQGEIRDFLLRLVNEKNLHRQTADHIKALMHRFFEGALKADPPRCRTNPVKGIKNLWKYDDRKIPDVYTAEEAAAFLTAARDLAHSDHAYARNFAVVYFSAVWFMNSGMREGELLALDHEDVELLNARFVIRKGIDRKDGSVKPYPKSKKERVLGINKPMTAAYREWALLSGHSRPKSPVLSREDGTRWTHNMLINWTRKVCEMAEIRHATPHQFRHLYASHFAKNGGSMSDLQGVLGHAHGRTTERYRHFLPGQLQAQADRVVIEADDSRKKKVLSLKKRGK